MVSVHRPATLEEALAVRARLEATPLAGGTDLMVRLRRGAGELPAFSKPVLLLDRLKELGTISVREGRLEIGSLVTLEALADSPLVPPVLRAVALSMAGPAIRGIATLGGNVCNASPAGDTLPFLFAVEARALLGSRAGRRELPVEDFIAGPGSTRLHPDELLLGVSLPARLPAASLWRKVGTRRANALTKVSILALAERDAAGRPAGVRIALGAVAPTAVRLRDVERFLEGRDAPLEAAEEDVIRGLVAAAVRPIDDQRSTAAYRRRVAGNLVLRAASGMLRPG